MKSKGSKASKKEEKEQKRGEVNKRQENTKIKRH